MLQVNGSTRDVFYYPQDTVSVRVVGPDLNIGEVHARQSTCEAHAMHCPCLSCCLFVVGHGMVPALYAAGKLSHIRETKDAHLLDTRLNHQVCICVEIATPTTQG